jgi:hypothetical protein
MTLEEILSDLGVTVDPAKAANVAKWNTTLQTSQSEAQQKLADAQKAFTDAQNLQRVIDQNITASGLTEVNIAQLQANNAALTAALAMRDAALDEIKKAGFTGINIPDLPKVNQTPAKDPIKELQETMMGGFAAAGQAMNESNRYWRAFGQPLPVDPASLPDLAKQGGFRTVRDYMETTYKVSDKEKASAEAAEAKRIDGMKAKWEEEYKAAHPVVMGHTELGPGVPSNYPNIPKPSDAKGVREMAGKSPQEKIRIARDRVVNEVRTRMNAA